MRLPKKVWIGVVVLALASVLTGILAPRAAHSLVSTLVTVVNTPAQPVPTLSTAAYNAFVASTYCYFSTDTCAIEPLYTVPAGKTAVLESASGVCVVKPGTTVREFQLRFTGPGGFFAQLSLPPTPGIPSPAINSTVSTTGQNLKSYAAGGTPIHFFGYASASQVGAQADFCTFTISGYLVSTP
jgi:hypothetical protein